jgi:hypothetical protein
MVSPGLYSFLVVASGCDQGIKVVSHEGRVIGKGGHVDVFNQLFELQLAELN